MNILTMLTSLLAVILSLAIVIGLAWGGLWLLRKFQDGAFGKLSGDALGRELRFERALPVGQRERLVLVDVDGEQMLLGVTAHSITLLRSWPEHADLPNSEPSDPPIPPPGNDRARQERRFRLRMAEEDNA